MGPNEYLDTSQTIAAGKSLANDLKSGDILCLYGDLGAGKTTFTKGLAEGLGVKNEIHSPTFTLMNVYQTEIPRQRNINTLVHVDAYRLKDHQELIDIGIEDYLGVAGTICVIEWPEKIDKLLENKLVKKITIEHAGEKTRKIIINP